MSKLLDELSDLQSQGIDLDVKLLDKRIDQMMPELGFKSDDNDRLVASYRCAASLQGQVAADVFGGYMDAANLPLSLSPPASSLSACAQSCPNSDPPSILLQYRDQGGVAGVLQAHAHHVC